MRISILCAIVLIAALVYSSDATSRRGNPKNHYDVIAIGGGIAGFSTSVYLKDTGYKVLILEKDDIVGGSCNTVYFDPPPGKDVDWIDIGVLSMFNTSAFNEDGLGNWTDADGFITRFANPIKFALEPGFAAYYGDHRRGTVVVPPFDPQAFQAALIKHLTFVLQYPWAFTMIDKPDPIPPELLIPFDQYVHDNELEALLPLFNQFLIQITTNYSEFNVLQSFAMGTGPATTSLLLDPSKYTYVIEGGCYELYEGMTDYLGHNNVKTRAIITDVNRPKAGRNNHIVVKGYFDNHRRVPFRYTCKDLIVAAPPVGHTLSILGHDNFERNLFKDVDYFKYYVSAVDAVGPIAEQSYTLFYYDESKPLYLPDMPAATQFARFTDYGPSIMALNSDVAYPPDVMLSLVRSQIDGVNETLLTHVNVTRPVEFHEFFPHPKPSTLVPSPTWYTNYKNIQGYRHTYYYTSLDTGAGHGFVINGAKGWVESYFPPKHGYREASNQRREYPSASMGSTRAKQIDIESLASRLTQSYMSHHATR